MAHRHLTPMPQSNRQLPEELRAPLVLHMDDRETVKDLKREVAKRLGNRGKEMGVPDLGRVRLSEVRADATRPPPCTRNRILLGLCHTPAPLLPFFVLDKGQCLLSLSRGMRETRTHTRAGQPVVGPGA